MTQKISADRIHPISSSPIEGGVLVLETGIIKDLLNSGHRDKSDVQRLKGDLVPGFVNTHCHLELSHMKGRVDTGTSLIPFITEVVTKRNVSKRVIDAAIKKADAEMYRNGIVAVGDISNQVDTFVTKRMSKMSYYTFIELFDFLQENGAEKAFSDWKLVYDEAPKDGRHKSNLVPHAPYSVSKSLFSLINQYNPKKGITVSIHNQETPDEEELFRSGGGGFPGFYGGFGMSLNDFTPSANSAIHYAIANLNAQNRTLFVHNTLTSAEDIKAAQIWSEQVYWATCPNANLYIENRLPNYQAFLDANARMTIGTDSLTSNWQLSILEEMKTIQRFQSYVPFTTLLCWATLHGAEALGYADRLGSFDQGKAPGVVLLTGVSAYGKIGARAQAKRVG